MVSSSWWWTCWHASALFTLSLRRLVLLTRKFVLLLSCPFSGCWRSGHCASTTCRSSGSFLYFGEGSFRVTSIVKSEHQSWPIGPPQYRLSLLSFRGKLSNRIISFVQSYYLWTKCLWARLTWVSKQDYAHEWDGDYGPLPCLLAWWMHLFLSFFPYFGGAAIGQGQFYRPKKGWPWWKTRRDMSLKPEARTPTSLSAYVLEVVTMLC